MLQQSFFQENISAGGGMTSAANLVLMCLSVLSAATDLWRGKVYNAVTVPGLLAGLLFSLQRAGAPGLLDVFCAVGFTVLVLFPFYRVGGLGAGDIKLLAAVSAFMPSEEYLHCFAAAFAVGAAAGVIRLLWTKGRVHTVHFAVPVAASVLLHLAGFY
jgi:prepilin peptidase CpaA